MNLNWSDFWTATVSDASVAAAWPQVASERSQNGMPGLTYDAVLHAPSGVTADCLEWRDDHGLLRGLLYHYREDILPFERGGNVNMWVDSTMRRCGIGSALLAEADRRIGIRFWQQSYTNGGLALVRSHLARTRTGASTL